MPRPRCKVKRVPSRRLSRLQHFHEPRPGNFQDLLLSKDAPIFSVFCLFPNLTTTISQGKDPGRTYPSWSLFSFCSTVSAESFSLLG